jgi:hypothetical protein
MAAEDVGIILGVAAVQSVLMCGCARNRDVQKTSNIAVSGIA